MFCAGAVCPAADCVGALSGDASDSGACTGCCGNDGCGNDGCGCSTIAGSVVPTMRIGGCVALAGVLVVLCGCTVLLLAAGTSLDVVGWTSLAWFGWA